MGTKTTSILVAVLLAVGALAQSLRDGAFVASLPWVVAEVEPEPDPYTAYAADFDGSNDNMLRGGGLTDVADGKTGTFSFWFRLDGGDDAYMNFMRGTDSQNIVIYRGITNDIRLAGYDSTPTLRMLLITTNLHTTDSAWHHCLATWDMATAGSGKIYIDGVDETVQVTYTDATLDYTSANWGLGAKLDGTWKLNGALSEFAFWADQYTTNVSLFRTEASLPSGNLSNVLATVPDVYFTFETLDGTQYGTGGDWSVTGTLTTTASPTGDPPPAPDPESGTYYVRSGATGEADGTDWTDAYTTLPSTLARASVYYIADGTYVSYTFNDAADGTNTITIRKATTSDYGTTNGWVSSYGDGQAVWTNWTVMASYMIFDGQEGGGPTSWESGHGIKVKAISNGGLTNISFVSFEHIEVDREADGYPPSSYGTAVYWPQTASDITFRQCWIHDSPGDMFQIRSWHNFTFEYSKMARNWSDATQHGDGIEHDGAGSNFIVRYSMFEDIMGTYVLGHHNNGNLNGYEIYGNIFYWTTSARNLGNGIIGTLQEPNPVNSVRIYNNTFANIASGNAGINFYVAGTNGLLVSNCLWYVTGTVTLPLTGVSRGHNWYYGLTTEYSNNVASQTGVQFGTGDPFTDMEGGDFSLLSATATGATLGETYNTDMLGTTRTNWDRGALEYIVP